MKSASFPINSFVIVNDLHGQNAIDFSDIARDRKFKIFDSEYDKDRKEYVYMLAPVGKGKEYIPTLTGVLHSDIEKFTRKK